MLLQMKEAAQQSASTPLKRKPVASQVLDFLLASKSATAAAAVVYAATGAHLTLQGTRGTEEPMRGWNVVAEICEMVQNGAHGCVPMPDGL